jgi:release factor glutamine methyltransferase
MRVGNNELGELRKFFHKELKDAYPEGEITALFTLAAETYLGWSRTRIAAGSKERINQSDLLKLYDCAKALARHLPIQYILGEAWFMDLRFKVTPSVLIPRPETEELVRLVLKKTGTNGVTVLDIGTGSGCIPISLKKNRPSWKVLACDVSGEALQVAGDNGRLNEAEIGFFRCDILSENIGGVFDVVISNPPYIREDEKNSLSPNVLGNEPSLALFVPGSDPILFYRKIIDICKEHLAGKGHLFFELNPLTASEVLGLAESTALFSSLELVTDMSGKERFLHGIKK